MNAIRGSTKFQTQPSLPPLGSNNSIFPWYFRAIIPANSTERQEGSGSGVSFNFQFNEAIVVSPGKNTLPLGTKTSESAELKIANMGGKMFVKYH